MASMRNLFRFLSRRSDDSPPSIRSFGKGRIRALARLARPGVLTLVAVAFSVSLVESNTADIHDGDAPSVDVAACHGLACPIDLGTKHTHQDPADLPHDAHVCHCAHSHTGRGEQAFRVGRALHGGDPIGLVAGLRPDS